MQQMVNRETFEINVIQQHSIKYNVKDSYVSTIRFRLRFRIYLVVQKKVTLFSLYNKRSTHHYKSVALSEVIWKTGLQRV